jgi:2-oxoglutarate dehydrogenase E1 component
MNRLGFEYRMTVQRDVVVDIVCYRRHGHNEGDEPSFTQPVLYRKIEGHPTVRAQYQDLLLRAGTIQSADVGAYDAKMQQQFKESLDAVRSSEPPLVSATESGVEQEWSAKVASVPLATLRDLNRRLLQWPEDFVSHPKVKTILARRLEMLDGLQPIDFATAETLAFASLLTNGVSVRLAGQDSGRGTFSQRHATLYDFETGRRYVPLNHLDPDQAWFVVIDSLLSEAAALGFEYGYSTARPDALTLWEAQFGDFSNGAQVQIDQFLAAGEVKWGQRCGLVLLLPHGHDGQGPEHSSARIERFLQLCAENNLRVAVPSTAANYFHLLRRQGLDGGKKPLVVMTPKSLLRLKDAGGSPEELSDGTFAPVIDDHDADAAAVTCVICCSGKVFYDLRAMRPTDGSVALVRFELLYPWPAAAVAALAVKYAKAEWVWCQEEPANMGALAHVRNRLPWRRLASRPAAASPATGSLHRHQKEQRDLVADALRRR